MDSVVRDVQLWLVSSIKDSVPIIVDADLTNMGKI